MYIGFQMVFHLKPNENARYMLLILTTALA